MAVTLAAAKAEAQKAGVSPPPDWAGKEDEWYVQWLQNGVNAGVPAALKAAGLWTGAEAASEVGGQNVQQGYNKDYMSAAPSSEWLGKRQPTPSELRRYAKDSGQSEDYARFSDAQLAQWLNKGGFDVNTGKFAGGLDKPTETGGQMAPNAAGGYGGGGAYGGGGGGGGGAGGPGGTYGGAPGFWYGEFKPPSYEEAMADPGYQFALKEGQNALANNALARGIGRTSGTIKDLLNYSQGAAAQQYGDVYNRAAQSYGINLGTAKDIFAPQYGSWQTQYGGNLQKYLQRQSNLYGLLNPTMPSY